jgi:thiamine biosynthesis lipoprotein ApbE
MAALVHSPAPVHSPASVHSPVTASKPLYECQTAALGRPAYVGLVGEACPDALDDARARLAELDRIWGTGGEIERLNARPGVMTPVSSDTVLLAVLATEPVARRRYVRPSESGLRVDVRHDTVGRLSDTPVDLGDLAAALAVDLVLSDLVAACARLSGACVRVGHSARAAGVAAAGGDWQVDVDGHSRPVRQAALAYTRSVSSSVLVSALVIADQAWRAHLLGTAALTLPPDRACALLRDTASAAKLIGADGELRAIGGWGRS